jgi:hypothetical protein
LCERAKAFSKTYPKVSAMTQKKIYYTTNVRTHVLADADVRVEREIEYHSEIMEQRRWAERERGNEGKREGERERGSEREKGRAPG